MEIYQKMYHQLFNAVTDALAELERQNFGTAADLLRQAQINSEELFLREEDA